MRIDVDKLVEDGWRLYYVGKTKVLGPPNGSKWQSMAAILKTTTYKGETIRYFCYNTFPWDNYKLS